MKFREYNRESSDEKSKVCPKFIGNKVDTCYGRILLDEMNLYYPP